VSSSVGHVVRIVEDNEVDRDEEASPKAVNKVDQLLKVPMRQAKASLGAAVKAAIGDEPLKAFGDKGQLSNVLTGEKVPAYLARIYQDPEARRRFALALLEDDVEVVIETVVRIRRSA
jgi:hypothetical protein